MSVPSNDLWPEGCSNCDSAELPDTPPASHRVPLLGPVNHTIKIITNGGFKLKET